MNDTCPTWTRMLAGTVTPDELDDVIDHVDDCSYCRNASAELDDVGALWQRLIGEQAGAVAEEEASLARLAARRSEAQAAADAVSDVLLPALPRDVRKAWKNLEPLGLFRAIDTLASILYAAPTPGVEERMTMSASGDLSLDGTVAISRSALLADLRETTSTSLSPATRARPPGVLSESELLTFMNNVVAAARSFPHLFLGVDSTPLGRSDVALTLVDRPERVELADYWGRARKDAVVGRPLPPDHPTIVPQPARSFELPGASKGARGGGGLRPPLAKKPGEGM